MDTVARHPAQGTGCGPGRRACAPSSLCGAASSSRATSAPAALCWPSPSRSRRPTRSRPALAAAAEAFDDWERPAHRGAAGARRGSRAGPGARDPHRGVRRGRHRHVPRQAQHAAPGPRGAAARSADRRRGQGVSGSPSDASATTTVAVTTAVRPCERRARDRPRALQCGRRYGSDTAGGIRADLRRARVAPRQVADALLTTGADLSRAARDQVDREDDTAGGSVSDRAAPEAQRARRRADPVGRRRPPTAWSRTE